MSCTAPSPGRVSRPGGRSVPGGFTLIELMIVVAIISLLAAMAIPNYLRFQCKAKQAEVKAGLSALYTSEKTFLGENNSYGTDLVSIVWQPEGSPLYIFGFGPTGFSEYPGAAFTAVVGGYDGARNHTMHTAVIAVGRYSTAKTVDLASTPLAPADLPATGCTGQQFLIGAAADINPDRTSVALDQWTVNEQRALSVVQNDCILGL